MPNSVWTETGSPISLVPTTTPIDGPGSLDYLTNGDKITLMAQYTAELAMKTSLDTLASTWSVSSTFYNNAVAAISTALINAGAPSNWATTWPDGTTSGPWPGIQTSLANLWAAVATQRTALQSVISAAQAAAAQIAAVATAVATATANAPAVVSSLPTLPNAAYPSGKMVWNTADGKLYRSTGSAWTSLTVAATDISGTLAAAQIASLAASQVTGQLSDTQIAAIAAAKVSGTLTDAQLAAISAAKITGTLTDSQLAGISAAKLTGLITGTQITDNAISTAKLAAGAVTAATIAAATITTANIAAGAITATEIAAGAITAQALTICDWTNLCYNPGFEDGTAQWTLLFATISTADKHSGAQSLKMASGSGTYAVMNGNTFPCGAGETYFLQAWVKATSALTGGSVNLRLAFYNSAGAFLSYATVPLVPTTAWAQYSGNVVTPANTCFAAVAPVAFAPVGGDVYWDDIYVRRSNDSDLIVDGTITAVKIAAGTITSNEIAAGTIVAGDIAASTITGANIAGHTITAANITAATITAAEIAAATITGAKIAATTITAANIAANTITSAQILAGTITAANIAAATITGDRLVANTITAGKIAAGAITASMITTGTLDASAVTVTNLNASNITTGTLSASKVLFADGSALTTASRVQTFTLSETGMATTSGAGVPGVAIPGLTRSITAASTADVFNVFGSLSGAQTAGTAGTDGYVNLYVDGVLNQQALIHFAVLNGTQQAMVIMTLTGLTAAAHTFTFNLESSVSTAVFQSYVGSTMMIQRVF